VADLNRLDRRYKEFAEDVKSFANNLELISGVVETAQRQTSRTSQTSLLLSPSQATSGLRTTNRILGDFNKTLEDCDLLLRDERHFELKDGFVHNIRYYNEVDPKVQRLRERIAFHNIKVMPGVGYS
jgi:hypothetical protein